MAVLDFSTFPSSEGWEREGVRKREGDKLQASTLEQPHSTGPTMEFKGACMLLGVLLLVNCSFQQNPPRKKPVKKGRWKTSSTSQPVGRTRDYLDIMIVLWSVWDTASRLNFFLHHIPPDLNVLAFLDSEATKDAAIEELQKQINDIVEELNLLKEQQALQRGTTEISKGR